MKRLLLALVLLNYLPLSLAQSDECGAMAVQAPSSSIFSGAPDADVSACRELTGNTRSGGKPLTLIQLEEVRRKYIRDTGTIDEAIESAAREKRIDCMIASGDIKTCMCIAEKLPVVVPYLTYVHIVTSPKVTDFRYLKLSPQDLSRLTGIVRSVRDKCITHK
jgi:hypothetical protein